MPVEVGPEAVADAVAVGLREGLVHDDGVGAVGSGPAAAAQYRDVEPRQTRFGQRQDAPDRRFHPPRQVEDGVGRDPRLGRGDAGDRLDLGEQGQGRAPRLREDMREAVALVIGRARLVERRGHAEGHQDHRHPAGEHQRDRQRLRPETAEIPQELPVERPHHQLISAGVMRVVLTSVSAIAPS